MANPENDLIEQVQTLIDNSVDIDKRSEEILQRVIAALSLPLPDDVQAHIILIGKKYPKTADLIARLERGNAAKEKAYHLYGKEIVLLQKAFIRHLETEWVLPEHLDQARSSFKINEVDTDE